MRNLKNNGVLRTRVVAAVLVVGCAFALLRHASAPTAPSGEERRSPGEAAGLRPEAPSGNSYSSVSGVTSSATALAPNAASSVAAVAPEVRWKQSTTRLKYLDHCVHFQCVGFDDSQAFSYDLDVNKQIAREIGDLTALAATWPGGVPTDASNVARYFLQTGNDDVKEAALKLMSLSEVTPENLQVALRAMQASASGPLVNTFLHSPVAAACGQQANAGACVSWTRERMQRGGENVQKTIARYSLEITNAYTAPYFNDLEKKLKTEDPFSLKYRYVHMNNAESRRQASRG